jgi:hypothetical protein
MRQDFEYAESVFRGGMRDELIFVDDQHAMVTRVDRPEIASPRGAAHEWKITADVLIRNRCLRTELFNRCYRFGKDVARHPRRQYVEIWRNHAEQ